MIFWIFLHTRDQRFLWKLTKLFFERSWPETCPKHLKWCCWRKLRYFKMFGEKRFFFYFHDFLNFFAYPGSEIFVKIDQALFWETLTWNLSRTSEMLLLTWIRVFEVVSSNKEFFYFWWFFEFFCISGVRDFCENWPSSFLRDPCLKLVQNISNGVADIN